MLKSLLRSPIQFFESTPIGRIMNRFSKDMNSIELIIPRSLKEVVFFTLDGLASTIVISIETPFFLTVLFPVALVYILVQVPNFLVFLSLSCLYLSIYYLYFRDIMLNRLANLNDLMQSLNRRFSPISVKLSMDVLRLKRIDVKRGLLK